MTDAPVQPAQARKSALLVGAVLLALAAWQIYRGRPVMTYALGGPGIVLLLIAGFSERASIAFHRAWMRLAGMLGWVNSRILLSILYFFVFTPIGWIRKLAGGDPLNRRGNRKSSYWTPRETTRAEPEQFERLF